MAGFTPVRVVHEGRGPTTMSTRKHLELGGTRPVNPTNSTQPWTFAGQLSADGSAITGNFSSAQGGVPVTLKKQ